MTPTRRTALGLMAGAFATPALAAAKAPPANDPIAGMTVINALGGLGDQNDKNQPDGPYFSARAISDARASGRRR